MLPLVVSAARAGRVPADQLERLLGFAAIWDEQLEGDLAVDAIWTHATWYRRRRELQNIGVPAASLPR